MLLLRTIVPKEIRYNPQQVTINEDLQGAAGGRRGQAAGGSSSAGYRLRRATLLLNEKLSACLKP